MTPIRPMIVKEKSYVPHLLAIACLWLAAMSMDYHDQAAAEAERAASWQAQHIACLNGEWRGRTESGAQIGCMKAETLEPAQRQKVRS